MIEAVIIVGTILAVCGAHQLSLAITRYEARNPRRNRFANRKRI